MSGSKKPEISSESIISEIVIGISNETNTNVKDVSPLYNSIDVDALVNLIKKSNSTTHIEFIHNGMTVIIEDQSEIEVTVANNR